MTASQQQHVRIDELPAEQLQGLGKQIEKELDRLQQSASILSNLATEYQVSNNAVEEIGRLQDGALCACIAAVHSGVAAVLHVLVSPPSVCSELLRLHMPTARQPPQIGCRKHVAYFPEQS